MNHLQYNVLRKTLISIPAPVRGRTFGLPHAGPERDFNSRPREGANQLFVETELGGNISIPAPVRGRTDKMGLSEDEMQFQFPPP